MNYLLVDTSNIVYRTFYGLPTTMKNTDGMTINAIQGTFISIAKAVKLIKARHVECVLEGKSLRRKRIHPEYKAGRNEKPDELKEQLASIQDIFSYSGFALINPTDDEEADDGLASRAIELSQDGHTVYMLTNDKDLEAVLDEKIHILKPTSKGVQIWTVETLLKERGIRPDQVTEYLALMGDSSDNVPGIDGIGPVTAQKIMQAEDINIAIKAAIKDASKHEKALETFQLAKDVIQLCIPCQYTYIKPKDNDPVNTLKNYGCLKASREYDNILNAPEQTELF
jgi:DNA polymerase-1